MIVHVVIDGVNVSCWKTVGTAEQPIVVLDAPRAEIEPATLTSSVQRSPDSAIMAMLCLSVKLAVESLVYRKGNNEKMKT